MLDNPRYTISIAHKDMERTVESSLRSILNQIDERFEVLVVDGGSTDGSLTTLRKLSDEYESLRLIVTGGQYEGLAAERNFGVRKARGEHILLQLDADDHYEPVIRDFVKIYEELCNTIPEGVFLSGSGLNIAPKKLLLDYGPYRSGIHRGEDADLWRRLMADEKIINLEHGPVCQSLGYDPNRRELAKQRFSEIVGDFRSGVTLSSRTRRAIIDRPPKMAFLELLLIVPAFIKAVNGSRYSLPSPYENAMAVPRWFDNNTVTVEELTSKYPGMNLNREELSEQGKDIFWS